MTKEQRERQIAEDEALAWQMEHDLGLGRLTLAGASGSRAPASAAAPASTVALATSTVGAASSAIILSSTSNKDMPPPPPPKQTLKRAAPDSKDDPAAKRQMVKQAVASRAEKQERKRTRGENWKEKEEKEKRIRAKRLEIIDGRIEKHFSEVKLIQSAICRSAFVPFMPEESEACETQSIIDACDVTGREMVNSGRYPLKEEQDHIRKRLNEKRPIWSTELSAKFHAVMKELASRSEEELAARRRDHPDAREIEEYIPRDLRDQWLFYKELFIKAYYFWGVVPLQDECSRMSALSNFLCAYDEKMRRKIFTMAELAEPKSLIVKEPEMKKFPMSFLPGTRIPDRSITDAEVNEAFRLESVWRKPSIHTVGTLEVKVFNAYTVPEEIVAKDLEAEEEEKEVEVTEEKQDNKEEAAENP